AGESAVALPPSVTKNAVPSAPAPARALPPTQEQRPSLAVHNGTGGLCAPCRCPVARATGHRGAGEGEHGRISLVYDQTNMLVWPLFAVPRVESVDATMVTLVSFVCVMPRARSLRVRR